LFSWFPLGFTEKAIKKIKDLKKKKNEATDLQAQKSIKTNV